MGRKRFSDFIFLALVYMRAGGQSSSLSSHPLTDDGAVISVLESIKRLGFKFLPGQKFRIVVLIRAKLARGCRWSRILDQNFFPAMEKI